jgi:hypothetical protein
MIYNVSVSGAADRADHWRRYIPKMLQILDWHVLEGVAILFLNLPENSLRLDYSVRHAQSEIIRSRRAIA